MIGEALLQHLSCFSLLDAADADAILRIEGEVHFFERDQDITRIGDRPRHSVVVLSGMLHRYTQRLDGTRQIFGFYFPTEAPDFETLHLDTMDHSLGALVDSRVALINHSHLYALMDRHPRVLAAIWRQTLVQSSVFRAWLMRNSSQPAHAAMAHLFCEVLMRCQAAGLGDAGSCDLPVTQDVLSDALGISLVHVNRTLQILRQTGAVEFRGGKLVVHDRAKLWTIADFDANYLHLRHKPDS